MSHVLIDSYAAVPALYLGRVLQSVAGSAAWLVCSDMITESAGPGGMGTAMGLSTSFIMIGAVSGPMLGGMLLGCFGYWIAWSVPIALLLLDMVARLVVRQSEGQLLVSKSLSNKAKDSEPEVVVPGNLPLDVESIPTETSLLLPSSTSTREDGSNPAKGVGSQKGSSEGTGKFYAVMLRDVGIWTSILNSIVHAGIRAGFNTTLPVYLRDTFDWGPSSAGAIFFVLLVPVVFLSPVLGRVRDRVGVRNPTTIGWVILFPFLCCLGIPGSGISWLSGSKRVEEAVFVVCICGIGLIMPCVHGAGALHMRSKLISSFHCSTNTGMLIAVSIDVLGKREKETPGIFGRNGGRAKCFAIILVAFHAGMTLGPVVIGGLFESVGYFYTNIVLGM